MILQYISLEDTQQYVLSAFAWSLTSLENLDYAACHVHDFPTLRHN